MNTMAQVPQKTLNWLYDVLKREYHDPNRTYSDLAQTLAQYPGFAPRTDVYTSDNGVPALLLNVKGTIPVNFRGTIYRFPIAVWIPHAYPYEAPFAYVTPTDDMVVRPGQHVSAADGRIYHHYLARWQESAGRCNVVELLKSLADIFSREPPVMAKPQQQQQAPAQQYQSRPPPVPPTPIDHQRYSSQPPLPGSPARTGSPSMGGPPPPPPKPSTEAPRPGSAGPPSPAPRPNRYDAPPPLPQQTRPFPQQQAYGNGSGSGQQPPAAMQYMPQRTSSLRHQGYPPADQQNATQQYRPQSPGRPLQDPNYRQRPQSAVYPQNTQPPQIHQQGQPLQPAHPGVQSLNQQQAQHSLSQIPPTGIQQRTQGPPSYNQPPYQQASQPYQQAPPAAQPVQSKPAAPKDLLSEEDPFQVSLNTTTTSAKNPNLPAPPIPTNPEKTALLTHLSHLILQHLHTSIQQAQSSALPSLQSQHTALTTASQTLNSELHQLQALSTQLSSNISALQSTLNNANTTIQATQDPKHASHPDNIPAIDQIIIPPTVVARQLYDAVAEQRGYEAAIFALNDAFVRGRIGAEVWGRKVRECAREEMRRKWLVRKIGEGLGLEEL